MRGDGYDRGWGRPRGYGGDFGGRGRSFWGHEHRRGNRYDAGMRGGYDRGWTEEMAYGAEPGMMGGPGMFTPFGWDPMMRWTGWDPIMGFVPYQDTPRAWSYGLAEDARRYDHDFYRGNVAHRYGGDYGRGYDAGHRPRYGGDYGAQQRMPPRQSPLYGRGGDRAVREWARGRGYDVEHTIQPRLGPRR
ncbi:hypothetical protein [Longimicrobium sp.]|uniref:hypothetical protein n=1 Tax=Longimicrobium sp. TaxID=2029185 RepID=UPI002E36CD82|nr:hypothetical protein [Longimicrobium sp.]HEX6041426.1 hypothetical protein [Longimicrobium sp.]